jgi:hypothetical protein
MGLEPTCRGDRQLSTPVANALGTGEENSRAKVLNVRADRSAFRLGRNSRNAPGVALPPESILCCDQNRAPDALDDRAIRRTCYGHTKPPRPEALLCMANR